MVTGTTGESVGAQEAVGECISNQGEHHRSRFGKEYQGAEPETLMFSFRVWGLKNGNTVQTPIVYDVKDENLVQFGPRTSQQVQISCGQVLFPQSRQSRHNVRCERAVPENVRS